MRFFNGKAVELLAPAGTFEIFEKVVRTNCDAVYFGGKNFNMRLHRKNFNFSDEEVKDAVRIAHELGKKAYITVNNMYDDSELPELENYLQHLASAAPDALIVQDLAVIKMIRDLGLPLEVHSSVMMNVHNLPMIEKLRQFSVSRVVMSRELPLSYIRELSFRTDMEFEYFVHGDMCVAHGGQCLYSGILFGNSSNRGRCLKPCRWNFNLEQIDGKRYETEFPLAVKDMYMYENIPELIYNNVTSFKIEGRMRDFDYLENLIELYGNAIDRYIDDPVSFERKTGSDYLYENRKRDMSTAYAFGKPGLKNINQRYEGTGKFYSTGKVFSVAAEEKEMSNERISIINRKLEENNISNDRSRKLSVKVNNMKQAKMCLELGVDWIYLSGNVFGDSKPFSKSDILELTAEKGQSEIYLCLPHMMSDMDFDEYEMLFKTELGVDGLVVSNLGAAGYYKDKSFVGDYSLNILNEKNWAFYEELGMKRFTISPEATLKETVQLINKVNDKAELIVYGSPVIMYLEHDLFENIVEDDKQLYLVDDKGFKHPVYKDNKNRNHIIMYKDLCYLPILKSLYQAGLSNFRIEARYLDVEALEKVIKTYQNALEDLDNAEKLMENFKPQRVGFTLGALEFD